MACNGEVWKNHFATKRVEVIDFMPSVWPVAGKRTGEWESGNLGVWESGSLVERGGLGVSRL